MISWFAYVSDFQGGEPREYDIFTHSSFRDAARKITREYAKVLNETGEFDREAYGEEIRKELFYYFWKKCEWEIVLSHWPESLAKKSRKIDVYDQVTLNFPAFIDYIWDRKGEWIA